MPDLAIVGAGIMGANHGRVARTLPGVRLAAVCDPDPERATAVAHGTGAVVTADLDEALAACDAVVLAVPSHLHGVLGEHVLKAGKDLLVEKPMATELADAERLIDAAATYDRILMVGHVERFNPAVVELRRLVTEPLALDFSRVGPFYARNLADVVLDLMIHDIDLARAIVGAEIVEQHAMARAVRTNEPDLACALLRFDNGVVANLTASRVSQNKIRRITLTQRDNAVVADLLRQQVEVHRIEHSEFLADGGVRYRQSGLVEIPYLAEHGEPLMHELRHFTGCVQRRERPAVTGEDGLAALRVCLAIRDSVTGG